MLLEWYLGLDMCVKWTKQRMRKEIWYGDLLNLSALLKMKKWEVNIREVLET
jgi:hypothetical protein